MDFFFEPFWYIEYEKIYTEYYSRLDYFKMHAQIEFSEEEIKRESYQLNVLHNIFNNIRFHYKSYFCSDYKDFEKLIDFSFIKHKHHYKHHHFKIPIPKLSNDDTDEDDGIEKYELNLMIL